MRELKKRLQFLPIINYWVSLEVFYDGADALKNDAGSKPIFLDVDKTIDKKYTYKMMKLTVTKKSIVKIRKLSPPFGHARKIRTGQVNKIKQGLEQGRHFESPLVFELVNNVGDEAYRTLDGGHRLEATIKYLNEAPKGSKISFYVALYDFNGMSDEEKKKARCEIYNKWNSGTKQNTDDYIESYRDEIPMFERIAGMDKTIPCTVYGSGDENDKNTLKFKDVVGGYFAGTKKGYFEGGYSGGPKKFVDDCIKKPLTETDVKNMENSWNILSLAYDIKLPYAFKKEKGMRPTLQQCVIKTTPFYSLLRIILENKKRFSDEEIITRLQRDAVKETIRRFSPQGGRESCKMCHKMLIYQINKDYEGDIERQFYPKMDKKASDDAKEEVENYLRSVGETQEDDEDPEMQEEAIEDKELDEETKGKWAKFKGKYK